MEHPAFCQNSSMLCNSVNLHGFILQEDKHFKFDLQNLHFYPFDGIVRSRVPSLDIHGLRHRQILCCHFRNITAADIHNKPHSSYVILPELRT
jgi:hypothetical protein